MLKAKNKKCIECGREDMPWFSKKRCKFCASKSYAKPKSITSKHSSAKKQQSEKRNVYFETLIPLCKRSEESSTPIYEASRMNVCHLFPKRIYKSVQDNLLNHVFLTADEHTKFDRLLDTMNFEELEKEFPNCWSSVVVPRMKSLIPFITEQKNLKIKFEQYVHYK